MALSCQPRNRAPAHPRLWRARDFPAPACHKWVLSRRQRRPVFGAEVERVLCKDVLAREGLGGRSRERQRRRIVTYLENP